MHELTIKPSGHFIAIACAWLLLGWLQAHADDPTAARLQQRPLTIVTLGDSITKGVRTGVAAEQTFAALMEKGMQHNGIPTRVINVGIGGERTDQALKRLDQIIQLPNDTDPVTTKHTTETHAGVHVLHGQPDVVTVMYGTNDSYVDKGATTSRITIEEYRQNLETIVAQLLRRGILPVLMTEPRWSERAAPNGLGENPNERLEPYMVACRQTAAKWRVPLIDHFAAWTAAGKAWY